MNKFYVTYLCHRELGARHIILSAILTEPRDIYNAIKDEGGFMVDGLLCRRWVPVNAVISVDTEHGK